MGLKAKARAAAHGVSRPCLWRIVVIHASAWEATFSVAGQELKQSVSIHASAWEATGGARRKPAAYRCFNPRLRVGGDAGLRVWRQAADEVSIHASAWEATRILPDRLKVIEFQSTPPRGRRPSFCAGAGVGGVSIHASAWEATRANAMTTALSLFQSTPPRGRRQVHGVIVLLPSMVSIHASAWEATTSPP